MRSKAASVLGVVLLGSLAVPQQASASHNPQGAEASSHCPNPRTCDYYEFLFLETEAHWEIGEDGVARVPYFINPTGTLLPEETVIAAIQAATKTWEDWNPSLRFDYQGTTVRLPGPPGIRDGMNVIGFASPHSLAAVCCTGQPHITEFDILLHLGRWNTDPCEQADGSCTHACEPPPTAFIGGSGCVDSRANLQSIVTHELGHALGLADLEQREYCHLTMNGGFSEGCDVSNNRMVVTLGLGDVLGAKALYPWECPAGPVPHAYRNVCPSITIYVP